MAALDSDEQLCSFCYYYLDLETILADFRCCAMSFDYRKERKFGVGLKRNKSLSRSYRKLERYLVSKGRC